MTSDAAILAAVLQAVAESAGDSHGRALWDTLASLTGGQGAGPDHWASGAAALLALGGEPGDLSRAQALAQLMLARAGLDPGFARQLATWRGHKQIQALEKSLSRARPAAGSAAAAGAKKPWYRKTAVYVGSAILTPVLATVLTAIATNGPGSLFGGIFTGHNPSAAPPQSDPGAQSAAPTTAGGEPVAVNAVSVLKLDQAPGYVLPSPVDLSQAQLTQLNNAGTWTAWFASHDAIDPGSSEIQVAVTGNAAKRAQIIGINVLRSCGKPLTGTAFLTPGGQGLGPTIPINFNLDAPNPVALTPHGAPFFAGNSLTLDPGESATLNLSVTTEHYYCRYKFQLVVLVGKTQTPELVTDNGNWFEVTAKVPNHEYSALYAGEGLVTNTGFVRVNPATFQA